MAFNYTRAAATARRLITNFGRTVTLRYTTAGSGPAYNPGAGTPVDETVVAANVQRSVVNRSDNVVQVGDRIYLIEAPDGGIPGTEDILIDGGTEYRIVDVAPLQPGGTLVYLEILARA